MRLPRPRIAGAQAPTAGAFPGPLAAAAPAATARGGSQNGTGQRILRAITQEREEKEPSGALPPLSGRPFAASSSLGLGPERWSSGKMESSDLNLRTKSLRLIAAVAAAVLGIALILVGR